MPCNAPSELYLLKTHYFISRHLGLPFLSQPWMCGPHLLIHPIAELLPTLFYSYHPLYSLAYEVYQTDLKSTANSPALLAEIYLGTHDSTNQVAECEDHNPSRLKNLPPCTLNHCNGFSGFGYPDPAEAAAVVEPASSAAECCSGQRAESKENSSSPAHKIDHTVLYTDKQKLVK